MKGYLLIFIVFLLIFICGNFYVYRLGRWVFTCRNHLRIYTGIFVILSLSYIAGRILERYFPAGTAAYMTSLAGAYWFAFLLYGGIGVLIVDVIAWGGHIRGKLMNVSFNSTALRRFGAKIVYVTVIVLIITGSVNAWIRPVREISIRSGKVTRPVSIVFVSDIHLGILINRNDAEKLVRKINRLHGDLVIIGGDIFDGDLYSVYAQNSAEPLSKISAPLGVVAVTGNHDYFGDIKAAVSLMRQNGIRVLMDECAIVGDFRIIGRVDSHGAEMAGIERKTLNGILSGCSGSYPLIVVDHEPVSISESVAQGAFLHLSGHTHAGQMWPVSIITSRLFELDRGYRVIDNTHCVVSSGYGTWGPPVRIGNRPEVLKINIIPDK